jgi:hypothetical protein
MNQSRGDIFRYRMERILPAAGGNKLESGHGRTGRDFSSAEDQEYAFSVRLIQVWNVPLRDLRCI